MNIENIKFVRDHIAGLPPERFDMLDWASGDLVHSCRTSGCIGGWTIAVLNPEGHAYDHRLAYDLLGLDRRQGQDLMFGAGTSEIVSIPQAVAVLDHLLATGEVDWRVAERVAA